MDSPHVTIELRPEAQHLAARLADWAQERGLDLVEVGDYLFRDLPPVAKLEPAPAPPLPSERAYSMTGVRLPVPLNLTASSLGVVPCYLRKDGCLAPFKWRGTWRCGCPTERRAVAP